MSKVLIGEQPCADRTVNHAACATAVCSDGALAGTAVEAKIVESVDADRVPHLSLDPAGERALNTPDQTLHPRSENSVTKDKNASHRYGLPAGFVSRLGRYGRSVLLEDNVYRLPNGIEFIPQPPAGTLGARNHQYALLTSEQYVKRQRGSVYVRSDGRIFDYAYDHKQAERDMFDTGFTIHDLERTGRYAPKLKSRSSGSRKRRKSAGK